MIAAAADAIAALTDLASPGAALLPPMTDLRAPRVSPRAETRAGSSWAMLG
jgi:hypothetical protein